MSDEGKRDDARKMILARRASFVAAALAAVACQKEPAEQPQPCLSVPIGYQPDASAPEPCLSVSIVNPDAAAADPVPPQPCLSPMIPPPADAGAPLVKEPQPCLKVAPPPPVDAGRPPQPHPCLTPMRPEEKK